MSKGTEFGAKKKITMLNFKTTYAINAKKYLKNTTVFHTVHQTLGNSKVTALRLKLKGIKE